MSVVGIPIRSFGGMTRLASVLDADARRRLARELAGRAVAAGRRCAAEVLVATADPEVADWASEQGAETVPDPGGGLDGAAAAIVERAGDRRWLVLHADLPAIRPEDLSALLRVDATAISPSRDGGTPALSGLGTFPFAYGPDSFRRHLAAAGPGTTVIVRRGLAFDVDRVDDLRLAARLGLIGTF